MRKSFSRGGLGVLILVVALAAPVVAQRTTGEIIGKAVDESGAIVPGVTVTLRGPAIQGAQTSVTSETGAYLFPLLPPGTYELEYQLSGFGTLERDGIQVAVGSTVELDVTLKLSTLEETLTVTGQAPVVNMSTSEVHTSYNKEWVENAPVRRFSYFDLINSAPGVSQTTNIGTGTTATSLGSSTNENQYQIDGTVIGSDPWLSTDAVEEIALTFSRLVTGVFLTLTELAVPPITVTCWTSPLL
jgi:carboxypeptidase family protein